LDVARDSASIQTGTRRIQQWRMPLLIGGPVIILAAVAWFVLTGGRYETTDDAYVEAARTAISASVSGRIIALEVRDNQPVKAGQVLFRLDDRDFKNNVAQAEAQLATARLQVRTERASSSQQDAAVAVAQSAVAYADKELAREQTLSAGGVASQQQLDQAVNAARDAHDRLIVAQQQAEAAKLTAGDNSPIDSHPAVMQALANLQKAELNEGYTTVIAPADGVVTRVEQVQIGTYINASQPLFWLVSGRPYVEANFKEDQLAHMRIGQPATLKVDALAGKPIAGHVASFSPGSGQTFSVLPAQNATGNWVKVVQRLPVRIEFDQPPPEAAHAGLSVMAKVDTRAPANAAP
jgi:membrane fusion protein (multidrug efflux system)